MEVLVPASPDADQNDRMFSLRLKRGLLVGDTWREAGSVVTLPEKNAKEAITCGAAVFSGPISRMVDWIETKLGAPKKCDGEVMSADYYRLDRGSLLIGSRTYTPESEPFTVPPSVLGQIEANFSPEMQRRNGIDPAKCPVLQKVSKTAGK